MAATPPVTRMRRGAERLGRGEGLLHQVADHGVLEAGDEVERLLRQRARASSMSGLAAGGRGPVTASAGDGAALGFGAEVVELDVAENGGLDSRKREKKARVEVGDGRGLGGLGAWRLAAEVELGL